MVTPDDILYTNNSSVIKIGTYIDSPSSGKINITSVDTTSAYINTKLLGATGKITSTVENPGANEVLRLGIGSDVFDKSTDDLNDVTKPSADYDFNTKKITNLGAPENNADAATKKYVDDATSAQNEFIELTDVLETTYTDKAGQFVKVNAEETGVVFAEVPPPEFIALTDVTETTYTDKGLELVRVNTGETGLEFVVADKTLVGLSNVDNVQQLPLSYLDTDTTLATDSDAKVPSQKAVKKYIDDKTAAQNEFLELTDVTETTYVDKGLDLVRVNAAEDGLEFATPTNSLVGLGNVDNVQQLPLSYLDTDNTLAGNSDTKVASQKATKHYVDNAKEILGVVATNDIEATYPAATNNGKWVIVKYATPSQYDGIYLSNGTSWAMQTSSGGVYTGVAERTVGGITDGMSFTAKTMTEMWDQLIKQEKFPVLTAPSSTFTSTFTGLREVGETLDITFNSAFSRGSIAPQYTAASPYRSGLPNTYQFTGTGLVNQSTTSLTDAQSVLGYTVLIGAQNWQGRVAYDGGVQPKSSYDNNYDIPLAAGNTAYVTRTITGVYPYFGTTVGITTQTKQTLVAHNSTYFSLDMVGESGINKQTAWLPDAFSNITGIQFFNTVSNQWEWIGGSKANSLLTFTVTTTTITVQGNNVNYDVYTHNGALSGARQLRFYTT